MKFLIAICLFVLLSFTANAGAAVIDRNERVAVMDFGIYQNNLEGNLNLKNSESGVGEYLIERLVERKYFTPIDREIVDEELRKHGLNTKGLIDPNTAKKIGRILNVRYLIYGNVTNVGFSEESAHIVTVHSIKAGIVVRIMDVETGHILMAAKGEGDSKSAFVEIDDKTSIKIGTVQVPQVSVHNALKKAAFRATDVLLERLFGNLK